MNDKYVLNERGEAVPETDLMKWALWFQSGNRIVKKEQIGDSKVSTVFLGLNHSHNDSELLIWETMVFGGKLDREMDRCGGTREQAEAMHEKMVRRVKNA